MDASESPRMMLLVTICRQLDFSGQEILSVIIANVNIKSLPSRFIQLKEILAKLYLMILSLNPNF